MRKLITLLLFATTASAASREPVIGKHAMVASTSEIASRIGIDVVKRGGNAVDAAVATAFALAVTWPSAGNLGGGGFMLIYPPHPTLPPLRGEGRVGDGKGQPVVIDYREMAPLAATRTMFRKDDTIYCARAVGVPGTVRGLALAHQRFGRLPWKDVVLPAVHLAEDG